MECYWLHHPCLAFGLFGDLKLNFPKVDNSNNPKFEDVSVKNLTQSLIPCCRWRSMEMVEKLKVMVMLQFEMMVKMPMILMVMRMILQEEKWGKRIIASVL